MTSITPSSNEFSKKRLLSKMQYSGIFAGTRILFLRNGIRVETSKQKYLVQRAKKTTNKSPGTYRYQDETGNPF